MSVPPTSSQTGPDLYGMAFRILFWLIFAGVVSFAAVQAWPVIAAILNLLSPFIIGLILAYVLHPIVVFIQHKLRLGRMAGILVAALLIVTLMVGLIAVVGPILVTQVRALTSAIREFFQSGDVLKKLLPGLGEADLAQVREAINEFLAVVNNSISELLSGDTSAIRPVAATSLEAAGQTVNAALAAFGWFGSWVATMALTSIATVWYLVEMDGVPAVIRRLMPGGPNRRRYWDVLVKADESIGGFLRGQLVACIGVGILTTLLMLLVGPRKYALLIGFMAGAVNFIPYLGPAVGAAPAVVWAMLTSRYSTDIPAEGVESLLLSERLIRVGLILAGFALIQAIDGFVFQTFIVGQQAALHPLAVMISLVVGAQFGVAGMILAVPLAAAAKVFFVELYWKGTTDFLEPSGSEPSRDGATFAPGDRPTASNHEEAR